MSSQPDLTRFEFLLTLGNNIICQRFFNVKDHKREYRNSEEIYFYMTDIANEISDDLRQKTFLYMTDKDRNHNHFEVADDENMNETYKLELKLDGRTFFCRELIANVYHPKVRYSVDIRPRLKNYLGDLTAILSNKYHTY